MKKIGIYGGTFNPPHIGHINAAKKFKDVVKLDRLIIMPAFLPPHKSYSGNESALQRKEMCSIAFKDIEGAEVSDFEINRGGKSYTAITLAAFSSEDSELYFLCGTDMFTTLEQWYDFETIFRLSTICYIRRENDAVNTDLIKELSARYKDRYGARIICVSDDAIEISSSELRESLKSGDEAKKYITPDVYKYIFEKGLYK